MQLGMTYSRESFIVKQREEIAEAMSLSRRER